MDINMDLSAQSIINLITKHINEFAETDQRLSDEVVLATKIRPLISAFLAMDGIPVVNKLLGLNLKDPTYPFHSDDLDSMMDSAQEQLDHFQIWAINRTSDLFKTLQSLHINKKGAAAQNNNFILEHKLNSEISVIAQQCKELGIRTIENVVTLHFYDEAIANEFFNQVKNDDDDLGFIDVRISPEMNNVENVKVYFPNDEKVIKSLSELMNTFRDSYVASPLTTLPPAIPGLKDLYDYQAKIERKINLKYKQHQSIEIQL